MSEAASYAAMYSRNAFLERAKVELEEEIARLNGHIGDLEAEPDITSEALNRAKKAEAEVARLKAELSDAQDFAIKQTDVYLEILALRQRVKAADAEVIRLGDALEFYADPATWFAVALFPDPPCGEIMQDFSNASAEGWDDRPDTERPGKRARAALAPTTEATPTLADMVKEKAALPHAEGSYFTGNNVQMKVEIP